MSYATLAQAEAEAKMDTAQNEDAAEVIKGKLYLIRALRHVTDRIDVETGKTFAPLKTARTLDLTPKFVDYDANQFVLPCPMVSVTQVSILGHALTAWDGDFANRAAADYTTYPRSETPFYTLQGLKNYLVWDPIQSGENLLGNQADYLDAIEINGVWVYRRRYTEDGWLASGDTVRNDPSISASQTTITVSNINGMQYNGDTPRFSAGQWIQIGTEWMEIVATDVSDTETPVHTLTVIRGVRGSTAAIHLKDTPISIWYPEPGIVRAAQRWVAYLYQRRSVYEAVTINAQGTYASVFPQDIPDEVEGLLRPYMSEDWRAI